MGDTVTTFKPLKHKVKYMCVEAHVSDSYLFAAASVRTGLQKMISQTRPLRLSRVQRAGLVRKGGSVRSVPIIFKFKGAADKYVSV